MDPDGQRAAGENGAPNLRFGSLIRAEGVECNVDEHTCPTSLLGGFLDFENLAALVLAALGAGAMGQLLLVAYRALGEAGGSEKIMGTTIGSAARRVAPFRIRHDAIPFKISLLL